MKYHSNKKKRGSQRQPKTYTGSIQRVPSSQKINLREESIIFFQIIRCFRILFQPFVCSVIGRREVYKFKRI